MLEMARERNLVVLATGHRMFSSCGMLYQAGLNGAGSLESCADTTIYGNSGRKDFLWKKQLF